MIAKVMTGDLLALIEELNLDSIQNAANGIGPMGRGIAGAIKRAGGNEIQADAFRVCNDVDPQPGDAYSTITGKLKSKGIKRIIHAVTMKQPGGPTSYEIIRMAFESALALAKKENIKHIGCTALGTATGGLDPVKVADIMLDIASKITGIDVSFVDIDDRFIKRIKDYVLHLDGVYLDDIDD